jgi:uncharacterized protein (TIGR03435 family)
MAKELSRLGWVLGGVLAAALCTGFAVGQIAKRTDDGPTIAYTVVSVRVTKADTAGNEIRDLPDGLRVRRATLRALIGEAYGFAIWPPSDQEVQGEPAWAKTVRFDIDAKVDEGDIARLKLEDDRWNGMANFIGAMSTRTPTRRMLMLRALLADRFKLKVHDEVRTLPVYRMVVAKGGPKLAKAKDSEHGSLSLSGGGLEAEGAPLVLIPSLLASEMGRPIVDATGLKGTWDFKFKLIWTPGLALEDSGGSADHPGLLTAMQEQLGLKLEAGKGPVHVTVVERAEMPGEN